MHILQENDIKTEIFLSKSTTHTTFMQNKCILVLITTALIKRKTTEIP